MSKKDIRICRYAHCLHNSKEIDISCEPYIQMKKTFYFHKDCFEAKQLAEKQAKIVKKTENAKKIANKNTKADIEYIKNQWFLHISNTVVISELKRVLNDLIGRGISTEYLTFTMDYIVDHKMPLRYPNGIRYYVDKEEIKSAYQKEKLRKSGIKSFSDFTAEDSKNAPEFTINNSAKKGFGGILKGGS